MRRLGCGAGHALIPSGPVQAGAGGSAGASGSSGGSSGGALTLTSTVVTAGAKLPRMYRCVALNDASGPSPALTWSGGPSAMSYAITLHDLTNNIAHWTLYDIPAATMMLPEGVPLGAMPAKLDFTSSSSDP